MEKTQTRQVRRQAGSSNALPLCPCRQADPNSQPESCSHHTATIRLTIPQTSALRSAAYEVLNYLREKRQYAHQEVTAMEATLQKELDKTGMRKSHERLYEPILEGLSVIKEDLEEAKNSLIHKNEQYIAARDFLSETGKRWIRQEVIRGTFQVANGQQASVVASRIHAIDKKLQYSLQKESTTGKQLLSHELGQNPALNPIVGSALVHNNFHEQKEQPCRLTFCVSKQ